MSTAFKQGDLVIFLKTKHSLRPGPRAKNIDPARHGDLYSYQVEKFWMVIEQVSDRVVLMTRTGKTHQLPADDPNLRRPRWWERLWYHDRFPHRESAAVSS